MSSFREACSPMPQHFRFSNVRCLGFIVLKISPLVGISGAVRKIRSSTHTIKTTGQPNTTSSIASPSSFYVAIKQTLKLKLLVLAKSPKEI